MPMRLISLLLLLIPISGYGAWRAALIGGSGEKEVENFFIQDLRKLDEELRRQGWEVRVSAGSRAGLVQQSLPARGEMILRTVEQTIDASQAGDQVLLVIHSHGREREASLGQKTHSIVSEDQNADTDLGFDLDRLAPLIRKGKARGQIISVVDLSCYSGTIHALTDADCTVSLAATDYVSSCSGRPEERLFTSFFFDLPEASITIEDQFLQARKKDLTSINFPQISSRITPHATLWTQLLYELDPLDVSGALADLQLLEASLETSRWKALGPSVEKLIQTRLQAETHIQKLRAFHEGPIQLLQLKDREVPVSPGRLGDWIAQLNEPNPEPDSAAPTSDVEKQTFQSIRSEWSSVESNWAPYVNPYLEAKQAFEKLRELLAEEAGQALAQERAQYEKLSRPSGRGSACGAFRLTR
jgi:hypothetical protein